MRGRRRSPPVLRELGRLVRAQQRGPVAASTNAMRDEAVESLRALNEVVERLRAPGGCPWDREQTHRSLRPYLLEETYEVLEAIDNLDAATLREELGDLLLQVLMHSAIAMEEEDGFDIGDVADDVRAKMIHRHPHVFGDVAVDGPAGVVVNWEKLKKAEKRERLSLLDGVPAAMPALAHAQGVQKRPARVGFDETPTTSRRARRRPRRARAASRTIAGRSIGARRSAARTGRRKPPTRRSRSGICSSPSSRWPGACASIPEEALRGRAMRFATPVPSARGARPGRTASTSTTSTTRRGSSAGRRPRTDTGTGGPLVKSAIAAHPMPDTRRHIAPFVSHGAGQRIAPSVPPHVPRIDSPHHAAPDCGRAHRRDLRPRRVRGVRTGRAEPPSRRAGDCTRPLRTRRCEQQISDREREIADAQTVAWLEQEARQLGYVFPGEQLYVIVPPGGSARVDGRCLGADPDLQTTADADAEPVALGEAEPRHPRPQPASHGPTSTPTRLRAPALSGRSRRERNATCGIL